MKTNRLQDAAGRAWRPEAPLNGREPAAPKAELRGMRKAAVWILAVDEDVASALLRKLTDGEAELLMDEIAGMGLIREETVASVLEEFHDLAGLHGVLKEGGVDQALRLVEKSFPPDRARHLSRLLESHRENLPFAFLSQAETDSLLAFLEREKPQTVAVVLAHMSPSKASEVLEKLEPEKQRDVVRRIASLQGTHDEVIRELEKSLRRYMDTSTFASARVRRGGLKAAADILRASGSSGRELLAGLRDEAPALVEEISRRLLAFEDLELLDDESLDRLVRAVDPAQLVRALKAAPAGMKARVLARLSGDSAAAAGELDAGAPVRAGEVEAARQAVLEAFARLEEAGEVRLSRSEETSGG